MSVFWLINYRFQSDSTLSQDLGWVVGGSGFAETAFRSQKEKLYLTNVLRATGLNTYSRVTSNLALSMSASASEAKMLISGMSPEEFSSTSISVKVAVITGVLSFSSWMKTRLVNPSCKDHGPIV